VNRNLINTPAFTRSLRRFLKAHPHFHDDVEAALERLAQDAFNPALGTHKLSGSLAAAWSCSAGYDIRVLFRFVHHEGAEAILLLTIGSHDDVY
jgi:mRNA-degrading endonuclease YafQ of YafQ-DinJ toxin-antitoxin module